MTRRSKQVSFAASAELFEAIEIMAFSQNDTIANTIRQIIASEMIESALLDPRAATTEQNASNNSRYVSRSDRRFFRAEAA